MMTEPGVYEARYGWNSRSARMLITAVVFVTIALTVPMSLTARLAIGIMFGIAGLVFAATILGRRLAFRVDAQGITLGGAPLPVVLHDTVIPWTEVRAVVLWRQRLPYARSMPFIGIDRRDDAPPLLDRRAQRATGLTARTLAPGIGTRLLSTSRAVNLWRLDESGLATAVALFGPGVPVIHHDPRSVAGRATRRRRSWRETSRDGHPQPGASSVPPECGGPVGPAAPGSGQPERAEPESAT